MPTPANISLDPVTIPIHKPISWSRYLSIPREEVAKMPEALQKLIGYNGDFGIMGKVDGMSPLDLANGVEVGHIAPGTAPDPWAHRMRPMPHQAAGPNGESVGERPADPAIADMKPEVAEEKATAKM